MTSEAMLLVTLTDESSPGFAVAADRLDETGHSVPPQVTHGNRHRSSTPASAAAAPTSPTASATTQVAGVRTQRLVLYPQRLRHHHHSRLLDYDL